MTAWKQQKTAIRNAERYHMRPVNGECQRLALDFRLCRFDLSTARREANGCVVNGRFLQPSVGKGDLHVICEVVDVVRYPDAADLLDGEARAYAALQNLQRPGDPHAIRLLRSVGDSPAPCSGTCRRRHS